MMDAETQAKLEKLKRIEENRRARSKRFLDKVKADGKKQISAILSGEAYDQLCRIRDNEVQAGRLASFGDIIERALSYYDGSVGHTDDNTTVNINDSIEQPKQVSMADNVNDNIDDPINQPETAEKNTDDLLELVDESKDVPESTDKKITETQRKIPGLDQEPVEPKPFNKAEIRKIVVELRDNKDMAFEAIAKKLKEMGYRTKKGKDTFHHSTLNNYYKEGKGS